MVLEEAITAAFQNNADVPYQIQCMHGREPSKVKLADWEGVKND